MTTPLATHGVLITFRRPDALTEHLRILESQTAPLSTLLVVDNDDDPAIREIVAQHPRAAGRVDYLGVGGNPGPAGGIAAGIETTLAAHDDDEWIVLLDDDDPPHDERTLAAVGCVTAELAQTQPSVGAVGLWGARLDDDGRLRAATGTTPEPVAYLPGGACPHYRIGALRSAGGPDPTLFFGFDDLDLGLALDRASTTLWSSGIAREHGWTSMVENRRVDPVVRPATWRRYYSLRNLIVILRRNQRSAAAARMSVIAGLLKPLANLPFHPRTAWQNLRINAWAVADGWRGHTGKRLDPLNPPRWLR